MRKTRVRKLKQEAFENGRDGSVVVSHEYKRLKKLYVNPHYARHTSLDSTNPEAQFLGKGVLMRKKMGFKAGTQNFK